MTKIEQFSIDSLKLRIPFHEVTIIDKSILDTKRKLIVSESITDSNKKLYHWETGKLLGEIISEDKIKGLTTEIQFNSYSIKIAIISLYDFKQKQSEEFLEVYLHSKILEQNYFQGFTKQNIKSVYDRLMGAKVFFCSEEIFLTSTLNDIDIKHDFNLNNSTFKELCKELQSRATPTTKLGQGANLYENNNLTFNRRETSSFAKPFVKFYDKQLEATEKNSEFFTKYFSEVHHREKKKNRSENPHKDIMYSDILINKKRVEVTCKKSSDIKKVFNLDKSNLSSILTISQNDLKQYLCYAINQNISKLVKIEKNTNSNLSAIDIAIHIHFTNSMNNQNLTFMQTLQSFLAHYEDKQMKIRIKKKCNEWNLDKQGQNVEKTIDKTTILNDKILDIFNFLQIN
jgi:hypothetical protein